MAVSQKNNGAVLRSTAGQRGPEMGEGGRGRGERGEGGPQLLAAKHTVCVYAF